MAASDPSRTIYLVDGTSQLYRAYFAIRGLTNRLGMPTNAVYGFATMLRKLLSEEGPSYVGVAFDVGRKVFRHKQLQEYKANRPPTPDDLKVQVPYAKRVCEAFGVRRLELEDYEADDVIATFARRARERDLDVVVVASDKDLYQLVGDGIEVLNPSKDLRLDPAGVAESFGVPPERVRDVLSLMGDAVDNVPGVPGVGQKTALAIVTTYGDLDSIIARAERFAATWDARDALVAAIDSKESETISAALEPFIGAASAMVEAEADDEQKARVGNALSLAREIDPAPETNKKALAALKRELKGLDKGSSKRVWYAIRDNAEQARLSLQLVTLSTDAPIDLELEALARYEPDAEEAAELFRELEFKAFLDAPPGAAPAKAAAEIETVLTQEALDSLATACREAEQISLSVECDEGGPLRSKLVGLAVACDGSCGHYVPLGHTRLDAPAQLSTDAIRSTLGPLLDDESRPKSGHDTKALSHVLRRHGLPVRGWRLDTMVAAFLADASRGRFWLEAVAHDVLGRDPSEEKTPDRASEAEVERLAPLAAGRAVTTHDLSLALDSRLEADGLVDLYRRIDGPVLPLLARMEERGIRVESGLLETMAGEMETTLERTTKEIHELAGEEFNVDSPKQLREVLFGKLGLRSRYKTAKGKEPSTDARALEELTADHPIAGKILGYRELAKLKSTYVDALPRLVDPDTGRVHTTYHPTGAATGRLSSSDPNMQNIPARTEAGRAIRAAFVPADGHRFLASDYSQIELRVLAHLTGDEELVAAFRAGEDIHRHTAAKVFGVMPDLVTGEMRTRAKVVNFGVLYGMSEMRLAREQGISRKDAREFIETYFERFGKIRDYIDGVKEAVQRDGHVRTMFGRLRRFPQLQGRVNRAVREQALRGAVNTTVQGAAADLMKLAMLEVDRVLEEADLGARILLQVHDELLIEVPDEALEKTQRIVKEAMEGVSGLDVPLVADQKVGRSWMEVT